MKFATVFTEFFNSEKASGFVLITCTAVSLLLANGPFGDGYAHFFHRQLDLSFLSIFLNYSLEHWINDGLMAIFFLLVGLEIERELYIGELSSFKNALLPVLAAAGGMLVPALIHFSLNSGSATQAGFGIPMATDIAFALGILSLAGNRVPLSLKVFLTALAIIDDLGAITVIALFYSKDFQLYYFCAALLIFVILYIAGKKRFYFLPAYLLAGVVLWYCMLRSGIHASISGVLLAFAIPFEKKKPNGISYRLQHALHKPVAFIVLPLFALANTSVRIPFPLLPAFSNRNALGIMAGLIAGKLCGIFFSAWLAVKMKIAVLPAGVGWRELLGASLLGGIGFTMSIFITNLAFTDEQVIVSSKMSILMASVFAAILGLFILKMSRAAVTHGGRLS